MLSQTRRVAHETRSEITIHDRPDPCVLRPRPPLPQFRCCHYIWRLTSDKPQRLVGFVAGVPQVRHSCVTCARFDARDLRAFEFAFQFIESGGVDGETMLEVCAGGVGSEGKIT